MKHIQKEDLYKIGKSSWSGKIQVWINPNHSEIMHISRNKSETMRSIMDKGGMGNLYIWNSKDGVHPDGLQIIKSAVSGDIVPLYSEPQGSGFQTSFSFDVLPHNKDTKYYIEKAEKFWIKNLKKNSHFIKAGLKAGLIPGIYGGLWHKK